MAEVGRVGELDMHTDIGLDRTVSIKQSFKKLHIALVVCIALSVSALYGQTDDKRDDVWFPQAQAAEHLQEYALAIHSLEQGLAQGGVHVAESGSLLRLYLSTKDPAKAHALALHTIEMLPANAAPRVQFAEILDDLNLQAESLAAWRSVLAVQPDAERGHVRIAQLLLEAGNAKASEDAATSSLEILPKSGALYLVKADAIMRQGRAYDARSTLEEGVSVTGDVTVLSRLAIEQEAYGDRAPEAYALLANALAKASPERLQALETGFNMALRDGNLKQAEVFASTLEAEGHPEYRVMLGKGRKFSDDAVVPGGLDAFGFVAHLRKGVSPDRFFAEYARHVVANVCTNGCIGDHYSGIIQSYLATISELESLGTRNGNHVSIKLSLDGKDERNHTQNVLRLLGLQMHTEKGQLRLDRGENQTQAKKQEILSALALDEVGLQEALQAGKSFEFDIHDESADVYPSAKMWKDSFPRLAQGQFALMLLRSPDMARLYVGISTLDRPTVQALVGNSGLYWFTDRAADLLSFYGTSFAVEGTHAAVPGGASAGPIWSQMVGASPEHPDAFYQALLQQKNSSLLAYFYALSHLDSKHQAFFTANIARAQRFYILFASLPESQPSSSGLAHESSFTDLLRSVPVDNEGHVAFPGSPDVWTAAKGNAADNNRVAKMMKKVSPTATPEVEDEVLLHLAETRYKSNVAHGSELENFLAVSRIDAHRSKPLDEETALLLAQNYGEFSAVYPYFTDLTAITPAGFHSFFDLFDRIRQRPLLEQNLELGQLHSLIEWVVLLERRHVIDDAEAARLFALICDHLAAASDEGAHAAAAMDLAGEILNSCGHSAARRWDDNLRTCLLGGSTEANGLRVKDYELVLDEQKTPSLDVLRSIYYAAKEAMDLAASAVSLPVLSRSTAMLPLVPIPKQAKVAGKEKDAILLYDPTNLQKLVDEWNENAARSPKNLKTTQQLAEELLKAMEPQVTLALAGPVYAYFMRSSDLVVSEDPLLLRKHHYFDFELPLEQHRLVRGSEFVPSSDGLGSYLQGGFAQFGLAAGFAVAAGWKQGGSGGAAVMAEQIDAIRSAAWDRLRESDQRLVALRILAAREWIIRSAQDPAVFLTLSEDTSGLLSLSRRADLLNGIQGRDWQQVWTSITLPDLFTLGGNYLKRYPSGPPSSTVTTQLRALMSAADGSRLDIFAGIPNQVLGCSHTHIVADAPYEEYERQLLPTSLAERTAEFKLFLAYRADSLGVEPADLSQVTEKLAAKAFRVSQMTDYHDWRSLLSAYASITNVDLTSALTR
jgi:tetratricopeptide (TPR) repeat protein